MTKSYKQRHLKKEERGFSKLRNKNVKSYNTQKEKKKRHLQNIWGLIK